MGSYSNMWWSVARRSWAVPLCRLQSLLSSNSKLLVLGRVATAMPQLLQAFIWSLDSDGITLNSVVECCPPFVGSTTLSSPVSPLKQLKSTIRLAVPLCYISADPKRPVGRLWGFGIWGLGFRMRLNQHRQQDNWIESFLASAQARPPVVGIFTRWTCCFCVSPSLSLSDSLSHSLTRSTHLFYVAHK